MDMPEMSPPDPIAFTKDRLKEIADVWIAVTKRKLEPYMAKLPKKIPAPIAKFIKKAQPPAPTDTSTATA